MAIVATTVLFYFVLPVGSVEAQSTGGEVRSSRSMSVRATGSVSQDDLSTSAAAMVRKVSRSSTDSDALDSVIVPHKEASLIETHVRQQNHRFRIIGGADEVVQLTNMPRIGDTSGTNDWMQFHAHQVIGGADAVVQLPKMPTVGDMSGTRDWMEFWQGESSGQKRTDALASESDSGKSTKYLTFDTDKGGFNNLRMAFEYFVDVAHRSGRTLVLPQMEGWYLIDWGPLDWHNKKDQKFMMGPRLSTYGEFFDVDYLKQRGLRVLTAAEMFEREGSRLGIPQDADPTKNLINSPDQNPWKEWLDTAPGPRTCSEGIDMAFTDEPIVHYGKDGKRFFHCLWSDLTTPSGSDDGRKLIHYNPKLFEMASRLVAELGVGRFIALHLRRNDFQYQQFKVEDAGILVHNLEEQMKPGEAVYIASDESDEEWWKVLRGAFQTNGHKMVTLADFEEGLKAHGLSHRNAGVIEQLVCSAARSFIGTPLSTYSAGIMLLRGEIADGHKTNRSVSGEEAEYHVGQQFIEP